MAGIDFSDFDRLAADLGKVADNAGPLIRKAVEVGAINLRDDWRNRANGLAHAPAFPASIGYDILFAATARQSEISAEIGPDKDRPQGALGNLIEYGSVNNPPQGLGHGALQAEEPDFVRGLEKAEEDARKAAGL